ncbi:hypothetical protein NBRC3284_1947 [Acetobacter pasteurianus NBRC 3284]|nr:hypothetical protein NBRC3284_1947 [Acetobacter pasteurianus NBRC 3284]
MPSSFPSMLHAAHALADGRTTARELVENALAHIADSQ